MIDRFSRLEFESVLPLNKKTEERLWVYAGFIKGEHVYHVPVINTNKRIVIRSSIGSTGYANTTGNDSIRHWLEYEFKGRWLPLKKDKERNYTARTANWRENLIKVLRRLWNDALEDSSQHATAPNNSVFDILGGTAINAEIEDVPDAQLAMPLNVEAVFKISRTPNQEQEQVIFAPIDKPLRVIAGPGAGKTFCMSNRYAYLLSMGVEPQQIASVTFSRSMADEALERICSVSHQMRELRESDPSARALRQINTIHGLCLYILRDEGDSREIPGKSSKVKFWMLKQQIEDIALELWPIEKERPSWTEISNLIAAAKNYGHTTETDMEIYGAIRDIYGNLIGTKLHIARAKFDDWMYRNHVMTFSDMLLDTETLLANNTAVRQKWQNRLTHIMIDEGQDTNGQAMRILSTLAQPQNNIMIVGDTDQLLYRFIGATPEENLFEGFESRYPDNTTVFMGTNYRSTRAVIAAYSQLIRLNYKVECPVCAGEGCSLCANTGYGSPYEAKYHKVIMPKPDAVEGEPVTFEMFDDPNAEAKAIAMKIRDLIAAGSHLPEDFFIGTRTCAQTGYIEGPLTQLEIPYINLVGTSFWGMKHVADVIAYLELAYNPASTQAFQQVYNIASAEFLAPWGKEKGQYCNHRYLGKEFLTACKGRDGTPLYTNAWQAAKRRKSYGPGVEDLTWFVESLVRELEAGGIQSVLRVVVDDCYRQYMARADGLDGDSNDSGKLDDLETVIDISSQYPTPAEFLEYVEKAKIVAEHAKNGDWKGHVVISTIHRLKGTERKYVIGPGWVEGQNKSGAIGLLPHTYALRTMKPQGVIDITSKSRIEDERDIAYVLVSRAKEVCWLTGCARYRDADMYPSRFIYEMGLA